MTPTAATRTLDPGRRPHLDGDQDDEHGSSDESGTRPESHAERLDREHEELFHELRAVIPGAEVLFAFLLTVVFTERFQGLTEPQRWIYYGTFLCAGASLLLLLAPSAFHRVRFRQGDKEALLRAANVEAIVALVLVSLSIAGSVLLITDLMFPFPAAVVAAVAVWSVASMLWWGFPLARRQGDPVDDQWARPGSGSRGGRGD